MQLPIRFAPHRVKNNGKTPVQKQCHIIIQNFHHHVPFPHFPLTDLPPFRNPKLPSFCGYHNDSREVLNRLGFCLTDSDSDSRDYACGPHIPSLANLGVWYGLRGRSCVPLSIPSSGHSNLKKTKFSREGGWRNGIALKVTLTLTLTLTFTSFLNRQVPCTITLVPTNLPAAPKSPNPANPSRWR